MFNIKIEFQNLDKLTSATLSVDIPLKNIAQLIKEDIDKNLQTARSFDGTKIAPNALRTIREKGHSRVFQGRTGRLLNSIRMKANGVNEYEVYVEQGRNNDVMKRLQKGDPSTHLPPRHVFGYNEIRLKQDIERWLEKSKVELK